MVREDGAGARDLLPFGAMWGRKIVNSAIAQVAGSGVGIDEAGRLSFPDGLDPARVHRFIELVTAERFASPKAALHALFTRVGVADAAIRSLEEVLDEEGHIVWSEVGRHPLHLGASLPMLREIPVCFRRFLVDGLGLADGSTETLEEAVVSSRERAAERIGCAPTWDAILEAEAEVDVIARPWRERTAR